MNEINTCTNDEQVDNTNDEEQSNIETVDKTISEDKALDICKEKLTGIWNVDILRVGTDNSGSDKIINIIKFTHYHILFFTNFVTSTKIYMFIRIFKHYLMFSTI